VYVVGEPKDIDPLRRRGLTCAERDDDGASAARNYDTAGAGQRTICRIENPQEDGVKALEFVILATLGTLEFAP